MWLTSARGEALRGLRQPAVAGSFYPASPDALRRLVDGLLANAGRGEPGGAVAPTGLAGILVPHAGLAYSGGVAAVAWAHLARALAATGAASPERRPTLVLLGTVHRAWWLEGIGAWDAGAWRTPLGDVEVDATLAAEIATIGSPFGIDRDAHLDEHSLEVQLPLVRRALPDARIVPLAVAAGTGAAAIRAGQRLGALLGARRAVGERVVLAISTDMAHYPPADVAAQITDRLAPRIVGLDATGLATAEADIAGAGLPGVRCGMCGIAPTVLGLAALRAMGGSAGLVLAAATSADAGGPPDSTVGYLAAAFPG